jgi:hypothetical protein
VSDDEPLSTMKTKTKLSVEGKEKHLRSGRGDLSLILEVGWHIPDQSTRRRRTSPGYQAGHHARLRSTTQNDRDGGVVPCPHEGTRKGVGSRMRLPEEDKVDANVTIGAQGITV